VSTALFCKFAHAKTFIFLLLAFELFEGSL